MGTREDSRPTKARTTKECVSCKCIIQPGEVYFCYRPGQRIREPFCNECVHKIGQWASDQMPFRNTSVRLGLEE